MSAFDVYLEVSMLALGSTQPVLVPYPANPVEGADVNAAVTAAAVALAGQLSEDKAIGTYVVFPGGSATRLSVVSFEASPVMG